jgi:hypothetical protein
VLGYSKLRSPCVKRLEPEGFRFQVFGFWSICVVFISRVSLIWKSEIWNVKCSKIQNLILKNFKLSSTSCFRLDAPFITRNARLVFILGMKLKLLGVSQVIGAHFCQIGNSQWILEFPQHRSWSQESSSTKLEMLAKQFCFDPCGWRITTLIML